MKLHSEYIMYNKWRVRVSGEPDRTHILVYVLEGPDKGRTLRAPKGSLKPV